MKYNITISPRKVKKKPDDNERKFITSNLTTITGITISDFSKYVAPPYSYTWSGGIFDGTRSNATWVGQIVFGLDFDDTISIEDVLSRFQEFEIAPQIWYKTFSATDTLKKFRVVIFLSKPITEKKMHRFIMESLMKLFPEADPACKDASRYFFGGKETHTLSHDPIQTSQLIDALSIHTMTSDSGSTRKLPLGNDYYTSRKSAGKGEFLYNIDRSSSFSADQESDPEFFKTTSCPGGLVDKFDFEKARKKIRIFDEFLNGTWLSHMQLFGLATNLIHIKGGVKRMKETMENYNELGLTQYTENNFRILSYLKKVNYYAQPIYKFSPYTEDENLLDFISTTKDIRGYIEQTQSIDRIELSEAEEIIKQKFDIVVNTGEVGKIYIFKLPTAIGKTEMVLDQKATIALPTNSLKNEVSSRMKIPHVCTPDALYFSDESINKKIENFYKVGLSKKAMGVIHHIILPENASNYLPEDVQAGRKYLDELHQASVTTDAVLTTHRRALFTPFNHDTLIFDGDPILSFLDIRELKISDVFTLNLIAKIKGLNHIVEYLKNSTPAEIKKTPTFSLNLEKLVNKISCIPMESNILDFLASSFFIRDANKPDTIYYILKHDLPKNKKIIVMSATIPVEIYRKLFGDRVEVIDITDVKQKGKIIQYTSRSCSRNGLVSYGKSISKKVGDLPVITFKLFGHMFNNPVKDMYFGNCSGYDSLKGKDIAVVGTPHRNQVDYLLTANALDVDLGTTDTTMSFQNIEFGGFKFKFNCFDHEGLRDIQLSLIESDLIQAVGRARTLRTDATVHLFSSFPLRLTSEFRF